MEDWRVVAKIVQVLQDNKISYAIVGGYSATYWGRPRFTQGADLLVDLKLSQIQLLVDALSDEFVVSPEDTILSKLRWCKAANFSERQFNDALGVHEIQERSLDQKYLDHWARVLDVSDLLERIRAEAALPPDS